MNCDYQDRVSGLIRGPSHSNFMITRTSADFWGMRKLMVHGARNTKNTLY